MIDSMLHDSSSSIVKFWGLKNKLFFVEKVGKLCKFKAWE